MEELRQKLQANDEQIIGLKNVKPLNHNLQKYLAYQSGNKVKVVCADNLALIDTLQSSQSPIQFFDVSDISKDIVTYQQSELVVFGLKDQDYLNGIDLAVTQKITDLTKGGNTFSAKRQHLKWKAYWRTSDLCIQGFLNTLSLSPIGDFMVLGGNQFISVWTKDNSLASHSFSQHLFYAKQLPKNVFAHGLLETPVEQIIQSEISRDGRTIICLEQNNESKKREMKIWYNPAPIEAFRKKRPYTEDELRINRLEKLECFCFPQNRSQIAYFKQIRYDISHFEGSKEILPIVILVFTRDSKVNMWVEDLYLCPNSETDLSFTCVHSFSAKNLTDASFLELNSSMNSLNFKEASIQSQSSLLNPQDHDYIQRQKLVMSKNPYDQMHTNEDFKLFNQVSQDFLILLCGSTIKIHKVLGLRNFHQIQNQIEEFEVHQLSLDFNLKQLVLCSQIETFSDKIQILGLSTGHLINVVETQQRQVLMTPGSNFCGHRILDIQSQNNLQAILTDDNEICFYDQFKFLGVFKGKEIKQIAFDGQQCLLVVPGGIQKLQLFNQTHKFDVQKDFFIPLDGFVHKAIIMKADNIVVFREKNLVEIYREKNKTLTHCLEDFEISEVMASKFDRGDNKDKPYLPQNFKLKCMLRVLQSQVFQVLYLEVYQSEVKVIWSQTLPGQPAPKRGAAPKPTDPTPTLDYTVLGRMSDKYAMVLTQNVKKTWYHVYIYEHQSLHKYLGYIDLLSFLDFRDLDSTVFLKTGFQIDFVVQDTLMVSCLDNLFIIGYSMVRDQWELLKRIDRVANVNPNFIETLKLIEMGQHVMPVILQDNEVLTPSQATIPDESQNEEEDSEEEEEWTEGAPEQTLALLSFPTQASYPLFSISVLKDMFYTGKSEFLMTIFIKIHSILSKPQEQLFSTIVFDSLSEMLANIDKYVDSQVVQRDEMADAGANKEKPKFDDFFGEESDDDGGMIDFDDMPAAAAAAPKAKAAKVEEVKPVRETEQSFLKIYDELLISLAKVDAFGGMELVDFLLRFKNIYCKDFFSDDMATILLRQVYMETENVNKDFLRELTMKNNKREEGTQVTKKLMGHEIYAQMYGEQDDDYTQAEYQKCKGNMSKLGKWDSRKCALALFSVNQDVILEELQERFDFQDHASWNLVRDLCFPIWLKDSYKLRLVVEWISKVAYRKAAQEIANAAGTGAGPQSQAEATSLWYILMNKKQILINLFEKEKQTGGDKVAILLSQDFSDPKQKTKILKNAMVLKQKKRFLLCVTLFILGGDLSAALQVMRQDMKDPLLSILTCRMLMLQQTTNEELPKTLNAIYDDYFIRRSEKYGDVYLRCIGLWNQQKYIEALNSLQSQSTQNEIEFIFEQDNGYQLLQQVETQTQTKMPKSLVDTKKLGIPKDSFLPALTEHQGFELLVMVNKLMKAPLVTQALNTESASTGYGADLLDFFDDSSRKVEEKKDEKIKVGVNIDNSLILSQLLREAMLKHDMFNALFLIRENRELINPRLLCQQINFQEISSQIIKDQIKEISENPSYVTPLDSIVQQIEGILKFIFDFDPKDPRLKNAIADKDSLEIVRDYLRRCSEIEVINILQSLQGQKGSTNGSAAFFRYELELRLDARQRVQELPFYDYCFLKNIMLRVDEQTKLFQKFVFDTLDTPFSQNQSKKCQLENILECKNLILDLEQHIDCLIIFDHFEDETIPEKDLREIDFFKQEPKPVAKVEKKAAEKPKPKMDDMFDDLMGGNDSDDIDLMDFDAPPMPKKQAKPPSVELDFDFDKIPEKRVLVKSPSVLAHKQRSPIFEQMLQKTQKFCSKQRQSILMHLCLICLAYKMCKFKIVKDILSKEDLPKVLKITVPGLWQLMKDCQNKCKTKVTEEMQETMEELNQKYNEFHFQNLKTIIQKFKSSINKRIIKIKVLEKPQQGKSENVRETVFQEKWETELVNGLEATKVAKEDLLGSAYKEGSISPDSYEFLRSWLQMVVVDKTHSMLQEHFSNSELVEQIERDAQTTLMDLDKEEEMEEEKEIERVQNQMMRPFFNTSDLLEKLKKMCLKLDDDCTIMFKQKLTILQKNFIVTNIANLYKGTLFQALMKFFFKNQEKMTEFWTQLGIQKTYSKQLNDYYLSQLALTATSDQDEIELLKNQVVPPEGGKEEKKPTFSLSQTLNQTRELLGTGIELFKQRGEQISDFAFDNTSNSDNIAIGLMASGIREIPILSTLLFRNRIENGLQLIDEEQLKWDECLHRYDPIEQIMYGQEQHDMIPAKDEPIIATIDSLYAQKSISSLVKNEKKKDLKYLDVSIKPQSTWNGFNSQSFLDQTSKLDITHEDYTFPLESHPHLPLYISGNRRGILCAWKFGQQQDKSLYQFMPEIDPRQADPKKACVKKIQFNLYGDKVMCNNMEGSFCVYQLDSESKQHLKMPIFSLYENVDTRVTDFDLVNHDNILCTISQKQKTVRVYDTLLPYSFGKQSLVMEYKLKGDSCGNMILCNQRKQLLYTFNGRTGAMAELDLRKNLAQVNQYQLSQSNEITAVCLNPRKDTLVTGYKDGHVKIHAVDSTYEGKELRLREKIEAFPFDFRSKKGMVYRIKVNHKTGGLFASSQSGTIKLLRTSV